MSEGYREFGLLQRRADVRGGRACLRDTGICVEFVAGRFAAGEEVNEIAADYGVTPPVIEAALRLVIHAKGTNLDEKRAARKVAACIPLLPARKLR